LSTAELKSKVLELLRTDEEFRYAVAGLLGLEEVLKAIKGLQEQVRNLQEQTAYNREAIRALQEQVVENTKAIRALQEQVAENTKAIRDLQEQVRDLQKQVRDLQEQVRALQEQVAENTKAIRDLQEQVRNLQEQVAENTKAILRHSAKIEEFSRHIQALGARWGLLSEKAFREAMRGVIERYFGGRVMPWTYHDEEGFVFGRPSVVEVDVLVRDEEHILIEVKSSVSRADIFELWRIGQLYERVRGVKPRLAVVSPYVRDEGLRAARELGIEVYTGMTLPWP